VSGGVKKGEGNGERSRDGEEKIKEKMRGRGIQGEEE